MNFTTDTAVDRYRVLLTSTIIAGDCTTSPRSDWYYYDNISGNFTGIAGTISAGINIQVNNTGSSDLQVGTGAAFSSTNKMQMAQWLSLTILSWPTNGVNFKIGSEGTDFYFNLNNFTQNTNDCACTGNLLLNPSFESGTTNWSYSGGVISSGTGYQVCGANNGFLQATTSQAWIWQQFNTVAVGDKYTLNAWAGTHNPTCDHQLRISFYNSAGTRLSGSSVQVDKDVDTDGLLQNYILTAIAPTGTSYMRIEGFAGCDYLKLDDLCLTVVKATVACQTITTPSPSTTLTLTPGAALDLSLNTNATGTIEWVRSTTDLPVANIYDAYSSTIVYVSEDASFVNGLGQISITAPTTPGTYYYYGRLKFPPTDAACRPVC